MSFSTPSRELVEYIMESYHAPARREMDRLTVLIKEVASQEGAHHACVQTLSEEWALFTRGLRIHLAKEETILFPMIVDLEANGSTVSIESSMGVLFLEHDSAEESLNGIRELTDDYRVPDGASRELRALWSGLRRFDARLQRHITLENEVLFPRFLTSEHTARRAQRS